jgi:hypothetical protein
VRLALAALGLALAGPAGATLTDEKWAFVRATPCPSTGYKKISCPGYVLVYPACAPTRDRMRWSLVWQQWEWLYAAQGYCACRSWPVHVYEATTRGKTLRAVTCLPPW